MRTPSEIEKAAAGRTATTLETAHGVDSITVLETDVSVAYRYQSAGYDLKNGGFAESGLEYESREIPVTSLGDIQRVFAEVHENPRAIAVMGRAPTGRVKLSDQFEDRLSHVAIFEIGLGGNESSIEAMRRTLPAQFHSLDCVWSISPQKDPTDNKRAYLAFWMPEPMTLGQLRGLLKRTRCDKYQECRLPSPERILQLARPEFADGLTDPLKVRQGFCEAAEHELVTDSGTDKITLLRSCGRRLTKLHKADGTKDSRERAKSFYVLEEEIRDLRHWSDYHSAELINAPTVCMIRGKFIGKQSAQPGDIQGTFLRCNENFDDQPLHLFMIDIDHYLPGFAHPLTDTENAVLDFFADAGVGDAFKDCSFYWHLSSSAGVSDIEVLKCHVWLWSKTAYTSAQMHAWAKSRKPLTASAIIDVKPLERVQEHFTANPIFEPGRVDPVPVRCGFHQGMTDYVDLVIDNETLAMARATGSGSGSSDMVLKDPSEKDGLIGAFHKAFTAEDVLLNFLEGFEQVTERRYTWNDGGGTPEGVWVHDDGQHIGSSHNTWPIDGIANLWDVVRVFKFGELDQAEGAEEEFETLGEQQVGSRPSDLAMKAWAATLPELKEAVLVERASELERLRQLIADAQDAYDMEHVAAAQIKQAQLSEMERAMLEQAFLARSKALGLGLTSPVIKRMLKPLSSRVIAGAPNWVGDWIWVNDWDGFMNTRTKQKVTERSFNATYDRSMAAYADENGAVPRAAHMALTAWGVPTVDSVRYAPGEAVTFEKDGIWYGNSFREDVMARMPASFTAKDLEAIAIVEEHAAMLIPIELERTLFLDYLAYNVQRPGRKIRWAPVLKGVEGDGKSAFIAMMKAILGSQNVRELDSSTLEKSDFTAWRTGQCFTGIEEMKLHGHNRYDVFNKIKTSLSNDMVEIHPKGKDPYPVPNTTNYLLLTNFDDGVPINDNDRRCMILRSPFLMKEDLEAELLRRGFANSADYFTRLFSAVEGRAGALRRWFKERELHPKFEPNGRAPDTEARALAVDLSTREDEGLLDLILAEGAFGVYENLVDTRSLSEAIEKLGGDKPHTARYKSLLTSRGFRPYMEGKKNQTRWRNKIRTFYYRGERPKHAAVEAERLEKERENKEIEGDFAD